ncbi:MotE family protein [Salipiger sp.]|uniref:MotE family protein n=1 Tax=Salipiger sp. TaxID=2078585 RepID=UPI003A9786D4
MKLFSFGKKTSGPRKPRGVLSVLGGLLIASALVRIVIGTGAANALETPASGEHSSEPMLAEEHGAAAPGMIGNCAADADIAPLLEALKTREDRVAKRETALQTRLQALSLAEAEIDRKMEAMRKAEEKLRATLAIADSAAEDDVARLTDVYATMKPKQAAALFEEMDPEFAAGFLGRMRADAAASIMAGLTPQKAYTISVMLAGRNALAPKE